ncbi:MAG TPA: DUF1416 domain-containing protein, partial [Planctomycetaceae bacterium]|nr:DUF1416 domain-containing protein [Planctomycetaceae bacterium]
MPPRLLPAGRRRPMQNTRRRTGGLATLLGWLVAAFSLPACGWAHKVVVFATVQEDRIDGEAYFRGGGPVRGAKVRVLDAEGQTLGETTTDADGRFSFRARQRCDHHLTLELYSFNFNTHRDILTMLFDLSRIFDRVGMKSQREQQAVVPAFFHVAERRCPCSPL